MALRGQLKEPQEQDYTNVWHTGPGTLAGEYLRTLYWHPVYRTEDLPRGRAVPVELMSEWFTLYRGESGTVFATEFRCAHRRTPLHTGWVEGDNIRCRYHGWMYSGTGQCIEQPGELESFAAKVRIRSYPVQEYLGLIFVYLGEGGPPPIQRHPDFEGPGILELEEPEIFPCNYFNRVDNAPDIDHVLYTHYETTVRETGQYPQRDASRYIIPVSEETSYGMRTVTVREDGHKDVFHFHMPAANQGGAGLRRWGITKSSPGSSANRIRYRVPVNDDTTLSFTVNKLVVSDEQAEEYYKNREGYLKFLSEYDLSRFGKAVLEGTMRIEDVPPGAVHANLHSIEDYVTQVGQGSPGERGPERLGRIDEGVILLRKIWERELKAFADGQPTKRWIIESAEALTNTV